MTVPILQLNKILASSTPEPRRDSTPEKGDEAPTSASPVSFIERKARALRRGTERLFQDFQAAIVEEQRRRSEPSPEQKAIWQDLQDLEARPGDFGPLWVEELRGRILEEFSGYEEQAPDFPGWKKLRERLESSPRPSPEDYLEVLKLADAGPLWLAVNERIAQLDAQIESAGLTDAIINLPRFWRDEDLELAPAFLDHQTSYIDVHRLLVEGKVKEAYEKFIALEESHETRFLNDAFEESQTINRCSYQAAIVVASGGMGAIAGRLAGGLATRLGATRGIGLIEFGAMTTTFTLAERGLDRGIRGERFFDPNLSAGDNALELGEALALNAGMFAFLGGAQKLFAGMAEKHLWALAAAKTLPGLKVDAKALAPEARAAVQAETALLRQRPAAELFLKGGSFGTELAAFGAWDFLAANYQLAKTGEWDPVGLFERTLLSGKAWEERLSFLAALKVGNRLGATAYQGLRVGIGRLGRPSAESQAAPVPKHRSNFSPAGLVVWPEPGADLLRLAEALCEGSPSFPNRRLVLHTQEWAVPPALDPSLSRDLQSLAESRGVTIAVKTAAPPYALEFVPAAEAARQAALGELSAAPGGEGKKPFLWVEEALAGLQRSEREAERAWEREHGLEELSAKLEAAEGGDTQARRELLGSDLGPLRASLIGKGPPSLRAVYQEPLRRLIHLGHAGAWDLAHDFARDSLQGLELMHSLAEQGHAAARAALSDLPLRGLRPQFLEESARPAAYTKEELLRSLAEAGNPGAIELWVEVSLLEGRAGLAEHLALRHLETGEAAYLERLQELAERGDTKAVCVAYFLAELGVRDADRVLSELDPKALSARADWELESLSALALLAEDGNLRAAAALKVAPLTPILEALQYFEGMSPEAVTLFMRLVRAENPAALGALEGLERGEEPLLAAAIPRLLRDSEPMGERVRREFWPYLNDLSAAFLRRALEARPLAPHARDYLKDLDPAAEALPEPLRFAELEIWGKYRSWLRDGEVTDRALLVDYAPAVVQRLARLADSRGEAQATLWALAAAGNAEALRALPEAPWSGVLEDVGEALLFPADAPVEGLIRLRLVEVRGRRLGFEVVASDPAQAPELLTFRLESGSLDSVKLGKEFYVLERRAEGLGGIDPSSFSMPFMIFGPDAPLTRGLRWLREKFFPETAEGEQRALPEVKALAPREDSPGLWRDLGQGLARLLDPKQAPARAWRGALYALTRGLTNYPLDRAEDFFGLSELAEGLRPKILADRLRELGEARGIPVLDPGEVAALRVRAEAAGLDFLTQVCRGLLREAPPERLEAWFDHLELAPMDQVRLIREHRLAGGARRLWDLLAHSELRLDERFEISRTLAVLRDPRAADELTALGLHPQVYASDSARIEILHALESLAAWDRIARLQEAWGEMGLRPIQSGYRELRLGGPLAGRGASLAGSLRDAMGRPVFPPELSLHLATEAGPQSRARFGEWRVTGYGKQQGRSYLVLERLTAPSAPRAGDPALPARLFFFSAAPLRPRREADGLSFEAEGESVALGARVSFLPGVSGGSGASKPAPQLKAKELGTGASYRLGPFRVREVMVGCLSAILTEAKWVEGNFRAEPELRLSFDAYDTLADLIRAKFGAKPAARRLVFSLSLPEARALGFEIDEAGGIVEVPQWEWRLDFMPTAEAPSTLPPPGPRLVTLAKRDYLLDLGGLRGALVLGRAVEAFGNERLRADLGISRRHARVLRDADGALWVENVSSGNSLTRISQRGVPTLVSPGERLELHSGDKLLLGHSAFRLLDGEAGPRERSEEESPRETPPLDRIAGEIEVPAGERPDRTPAPLPERIPLFPREAPEGQWRMLGRGPAPAGMEAQFLSLEDPVVRRRHLFLTRRSHGRVEVQALPARSPLSDAEARLGLFVEHQGQWMKLPPELPFLLEPGQRLALGSLSHGPLDLQQTLVLRLGEEGDRLEVEP